MVVSVLAVVFAEDVDDWVGEGVVCSQAELLVEFSKELFKECELLNELELFKGLELFSELELLISRDDLDEFRLALWCDDKVLAAGIGIAVGGGGGGLGTWGDKGEHDW